MPKRSWLSLVSKYKKQGIKLDDFIYALALHYLKNRGIDCTGEKLHQFCLCLIGNNFLYALSKPNPISFYVLDNDQMFDLKKLGHTYECWRHLERAQFQARIQTANKSIDKDLLIGFTQIYTPDWVVKYLIDQTIVSKDATVIDPACGTGNFILSTFDKLIEFQAPVKNILKSKLCAVDIDQLALSICALSLAVRLLELDVVENDLHLDGFRLVSLEDTNELGSLFKNFAKDHPLSRAYDAVLTNPPYIGRKLISKKLKDTLRENYPDSYRDLSAAFLARCLELTKTNGRTGMITQASLLDLPAFDQLRRDIINNYSLVSIIDAGTNVFPLVSGDKVNSAIIVIEKSSVTSNTNSFGFLKLPKFSCEIDRRASLENRFQIKQDHLKTSYRLSEPAPAEIMQLFELPALENYATIKQGLATTDNARFVKQLIDVPEEELGVKWFPYVKGVGAARWYAPITHVVDWQDNGKRIKETVKQKYPYLKGKANWVVKN